MIIVDATLDLPGILFFLGWGWGVRGGLMTLMPAVLFCSVLKLAPIA